MISAVGENLTPYPLSQRGKGAGGLGGLIRTPAFS